MNSKNLEDFPSFSKGKISEKEKIKSIKPIKNSNQVIKPIVKWAGGKRSLISQYEENFPEEFNHYYEPFFGGGALFFHLYKNNKIKTATLSDINAELMHMYEVVRDNVEELIGELQNGNYVNEKEKFYEIRKWEPDGETLGGKIQRSARLIYLNHTCYNGLYRVNKKGKFNVPYGRYPPNVTICDEVNLRLVKKALKNVEIGICDFEKAVNNCKSGDLIYFDPPYVPLSITSSFTDYTKGGFGTIEQEKLAKSFQKLAEKDCYVMLSNSDTELVHKLYKQFNKTEIWAKRYINSKPEGRKGIKELLITSF